MSSLYVLSSFPLLLYKRYKILKTNVVINNSLNPTVISIYCKSSYSKAELGMSCMSGRLTSVLQPLQHHQKPTSHCGILDLGNHLYQFLKMLSQNFLYLSQILCKPISHVLIVSSIKAPSCRFIRTKLSLIMHLNIVQQCLDATSYIG